MTIALIGIFVFHKKNYTDFKTIRHIHFGTFWLATSISSCFCCIICSISSRWFASLLSICFRNASSIDFNFSTAVLQHCFHNMSSRQKRRKTTMGVPGNTVYMSMEFLSWFVLRPLYLGFTWPMARYTKAIRVPAIILNKKLYDMTHSFQNPCDSCAMWQNT